jgi:hypothetical protein
MPLTGPEKTAIRNALKGAVPAVWTDPKLDKSEARWPAEWTSLKSVARWVTGKR